MKYSKTAICISGEVRTAIEAYPVFKNFFEGMDIDVFIHTWSTTAVRTKTMSEPMIIQEDEEKINKIKELYQPKKILVEDQINVSSYESFSRMFYSIMMANQLRLEYELENDCLYQWVVKYRFDIVFPFGTKFPDTPLEKRVLYYPLGNQGIGKEECGAHGISDIIFWGDSQIMTILCDSYRFYKYNLMKTLKSSLNGLYYSRDVNKSLYSPGQIIYRRAIEHNIRPCELRPNGLYLPHTLWRADTKELDPLKDYDKINDRYNKDA
jgi:hypothetical protein